MSGAPAAEPVGRLAAAARARRAAVLVTAPLGLCFLPAFLLAAAGVLGLGQAVVVRYRASAAADAAALAAADHAALGGTAVCAAAHRMAAAQGARVVRCQVAGTVADLTVRAGTGPHAAAVRSRAGPAAAAP